jgi:hypothetical protein
MMVEADLELLSVSGRHAEHSSAPMPGSAGGG